VQSERAAAERQIVVDEQLQRRIVELNQTQSGITPGREQLERLVEEYIDDEVMYREAMRMGLDRDDEIVRRRLIQKVQFLQRDREYLLRHRGAGPDPGPTSDAIQERGRAGESTQERVFWAASPAYRDVLRCARRKLLNMDREGGQCARACTTDW
jgi:hypothetical protein